MQVLRCQLMYVQMQGGISYCRDAVAGPFRGRSSALRHVFRVSEANIEGIWTHILDTVSDPASGFPPALGEELAKNVSWHPPSGETQSLSRHWRGRRMSATHTTRCMLNNLVSTN